jgi:hypothetical protein
VAYFTTVVLFMPAFSDHGVIVLQFHCNQNEPDMNRLPDLAATVTIPLPAAIMQMRNNGSIDKCRIVYVKCAIV